MASLRFQLNSFLDYTDDVPLEDAAESAKACALSEREKNLWLIQRVKM